MRLEKVVVAVEKGFVSLFALNFCEKGVFWCPATRKRPRREQGGLCPSGLRLLAAAWVCRSLSGGISPLK
jgi:hypothetical protein